MDLRQHTLDILMRRHWLETDKILEAGLEVVFKQKIERQRGKMYLKTMPDLEQTTQAQKYLNRGLMPMPQSMAAQKLNELMLCVVKPKGETVGTLQARCSQIASELGELPADILLAVINKIKLEETFFPPLVKFIEYSDFYMTNRKKMQEMITTYHQHLERKNDG